jgi:hypothetical protein
MIFRILLIEKNNSFKKSLIKKEYRKNISDILKIQKEEFYYLSKKENVEKIINKSLFEVFKENRKITFLNKDISSNAEIKTDGFKIEIQEINRKILVEKTFVDKFYINNNNGLFIQIQYCKNISSKLKEEILKNIIFD